MNQVTQDVPGGPRPAVSRQGRLPGFGERDSRWRVALFVPFGVYAFVYPFGIGLLLFGWLPPGAGWVGGALLGAQGLALAAWCGLNFGARRGLLAAAGVALGGWLLEAVGVTTGVPFGAYRYSPALGAWLGPVPAAIPFAWIASVGAAYFTARRVLPAHRAAPLGVVVLGAALATLYDVVLEPIATRLQGYWTWDATGAPYYGVPWANFATWFVAAALLGVAVSRLLPPGAAPRVRYGWVPPLLYAMSLGMFGLLDWSRGFQIPAVLAALLLAILCWRAFRCTDPRSPSGGPVA